MKRFRWILIVLLIEVVLVAFAAMPAKPVVWHSACVGCGDCTVQCPTHAIHLEGNKAVIDSQKCINCKICVTSCQYRAIR
jgi:ferredoxin